MSTLVTGGTGFVASNVVKALAERGHNVVCFDLVAPDDLFSRFVRSFRDKISFVQGDILSREDLKQLLSYRITKIVHAAVFTGVTKSIEAQRSRQIVDINVLGTANVLEFARGLPVERFLFISSGSVYGKHSGVDRPLQEDDCAEPRTLYELTKHAGELMIRRYGELLDFSSVTARLGSSFGPMERVTGHRANQSVLKRWTGNIARGESMEVSDREQQTTFTHVFDTANGIATILDAPVLAHDVYNVSGGRQTCIGEIIRILQELHPNVRVSERHSEVPVGGFYRLSSQRLSQELGFRPKLNLRNGIQQYLEWRFANRFFE